MHPRHPILAGPTPLIPAPRLSEALGIDLWIKRDDLAGPSMGGNKARQLEYYLGAALERSADTVLITGAVQSNFVRLTAAVACGLGMEAVVQLEERVPGVGTLHRTTGNVLLSRMLGARIVEFPRGEDEAGADRALEIRAEVLAAEGRVPYVIPLSEGHPPIGALGYRDAAREILAQDGGFDVFVIGSGSGASHAGLLAGLRGEGSGSRVIGACVRRPAAVQGPRIGRIVERLALLDPAAGRVRAKDVEVWDGALAPGYGRIGAPAAEAMRMMARAEGLILDPVYTAKSFAAIPALVADGAIPGGARVCFVHTGGLAGLFAYSDSLMEML